MLLGLLGLGPIDSIAQEIRLDDDARRILSLARQEEAKGNLSGAIALYEKALAEAKPEGKAGLQLELARFLDRGSSAPGADPKWLDRSRKEFEEVIGSSSGTARLQAANSFAAQLLRRERAAEAVQVLSTAVQDAAWKDLTGPARARCLFNFARALEATGRKSEAYSRYIEAAEADPSFERAADGARAVALKSDSEGTGIPQIDRLVDGQLARGDFSGAGRSLRDALTSVAHWQGHPNYPRLVEELARYLTEANVQRDRFAQEWSEPLRTIPRDRVRKPADRMLATIEEAYTSELPVEFAPENVQERYAPWAQGASRGLFSRFLAAVAAQSYRLGEMRRALGAYSHAWALDTTNMEAALYAANILLVDLEAKEKKLDPDGSLLKSLVDKLFSEKGAEYSRDVGQDWNRLLKFHTILATIFEKQRRWGDEHEARSAIFQWKMALRAVERLQGKDPGAARLAPPLQEGLGRAYRARGQPQEAFEHEVQAAEGFVRTAGGDVAQLEAAERALARAALLAIIGKAGESSMKKVRDLHRTIDETRKPVVR
jgi:tetratricopeptide (TPR) repeat protein